MNSMITSARKLDVGKLALCVGCALILCVSSCKVPVSPGANYNGYVRLLDGGGPLVGVPVMKQAADGGIFVFLTVQVPTDTTPSVGAELFKCSSSGDLEWKQQYSNGLTAEDLVPLADGGAMLLAQDSVTAKLIRIALLHVDNQGRLVSGGRREFQNTTEANRGYRLQPTANGGYVIAGVVRNSLNGNSPAFFLTLSATFDTSWSMLSLAQNSTPIYTPNDLVLPSSGVELSTCTLSPPQTASGSSPQLLFHDPKNVNSPDPYIVFPPAVKGNSFNGNGTYRAIIPVGDQYVLLGDSSDYGTTPCEYAAKISKGNYAFPSLDWSYSGATDAKNSFLGGVGLSDGGVIATGFAASLAGDTAILVTHLDKNGIPLWSNTYNFGGGDVGHNVVTTPDGGFIVSGITTSFGPHDGTRQAFLIRFNANGDYTK